LIILSIIAAEKSNFTKLIKPNDPDTNSCGYDSNVKDYPYIYMAVPYIGYTQKRVCVKECPKAGDTTVKCYPNSKISECIHIVPDNFDERRYIGYNHDDPLIYL